MMRDNRSHAIKKTTSRNVTAACDACRKRRCKCSNGSPCHACKLAGISCTFSKPDLRVLRHARVAESISTASNGQRLAEADTTNHKQEYVKLAMLAPPKDHPSTVSASVNGQAPQQQSQDPPLAKRLQNRFRLEKTVHKYRPPHNRISRSQFVAPGYTRSFGNLPFSSSLISNGYSASVQARQSLLFTTLEYQIPPLAESDGSPLSAALSDFQRLCKRLIADGVPTSQLIGQDSTEVTLFFRERWSTDQISVSSWTCEMLRAFKGTFSDQLLLACAVCVTALVKWLIAPTATNYSNMPSIIRPTPCQRLKPHASWIDVMIFPTFRDSLVERARDWAGPCMKARWDFLWCRPIEEALIHDPSTGRIYLNPEFTELAGQAQHWIMQKSIYEDFPEVRNSEMRISDDEDGRNEY